jgi:uncharacterized protein
VKHLAWIRLACVFFVLTAQVADAEKLTEEKARDIDHLLEMTGAFKVGQQYSDLFIRQFNISLERARPDIPERAFEIIEKEVRKIVAREIERPMGFRNEIRYIYHKYFTQSEIKELIAFNETPLGKKIIRITPVITQEGIQAGQAWGKSLEPVIRKKVFTILKEEGILEE